MDPDDPIEYLALETENLHHVFRAETGLFESECQISSHYGMCWYWLPTWVPVPHLSPRNAKRNKPAIIVPVPYRATPKPKATGIGVLMQLQSEPSLDRPNRVLT